MRTLKLVGMALFAAVMNVGLVACSNDEDDQTTSEKLLGTWVCTSASPSGTYQLFEKGSKVRFEQNGYCYIRPNENDEGYGGEWLWQIKDNRLAIMENLYDNRFVGSITVKGDEMTITYHYQDWNADYHMMTSEDPVTHNSKFKRVSED